MPGFSPRAVGVLQLPAAFELGCQVLAAAVWGLWLTVSPLLELCRERGGVSEPDPAVRAGAGAVSEPRVNTEEFSQRTGQVVAHGRRKAGTVPSDGHPRSPLPSRLFPMKWWSGRGSPGGAGRLAGSATGRKSTPWPLAARLTTCTRVATATLRSGTRAPCMPAARPHRPSWTCR